MFSRSHLLRSLPILLVLVLQPAMAEVITGETCANGAAYIFYAPSGSGLVQKAVCANGPGRPPTPAGYRSLQSAVCNLPMWERNNNSSNLDVCAGVSSGCSAGFVYYDDTTDASPYTCTASSCTAAGTCTSACTADGGTLANNQCTAVPGICRANSDCSKAYQSCSPSTRRCGASCGTTLDGDNRPISAFCYGSDFCTSPGSGTCATCPTSLASDGSCPDFTPTASRAAGARRNKRTLAYLQSLLLNPDCPVGLTSCPIPGSRGAFECLDVTQELTSCGGCASEGAGEDCSAMSGVSRLGGVTCAAGKCEARACIQGFELFSGRCIEGLRHDCAT